MHECPTCGSTSPAWHPAVQFEGEVEPCIDPFHDADDRQSEWLKNYIAEKREGRDHAAQLRAVARRRQVV